MGDGPVANLPPGLDAYAGYADNSGIGVTWTGVLALPAKYHLSISIHGTPAMCADVETGAMSSWKGYDYGYCSISQAQTLINRDGRPKKLWTAHYTGVPHICNPSCGFGFTGTADGTQWTDHGGVWDESLLLDDFFDLTQPLTPEVPDVLDASDQTFITTAVTDAINHAVGLVLVGDSPAAAAGTAPQGHPYNLTQIGEAVNALAAAVKDLQAKVAAIPTTSTVVGSAPPNYTGTINLTPG